MGLVAIASVGFGAGFVIALLVDGVAGIWENVWDIADHL